MQPITAGQLSQTSAPILDVRRHRHGKQIRGSVHYDPSDLVRSGKLVLPLPHDKPIAVYGDNEAEAEEIARVLREAGYAGATVLSGGMEAWQEADLPIEDLTQDQPVPGNESTGQPLL